MDARRLLMEEDVNTPNVAGKRVNKTIGLILIAAYTMALVFATWDEIDLHAPTQWSLSLGAAMIGIFVLISGKVAWSKLDLLVCITAVYFTLRALLSPVALYGRMDASLVISAFVFWIALKLFSSRDIRRVWMMIAVVMLVAHLGTSWYQMNIDASWCVLRMRSGPASEKASGLFGHYNYLANYLAMLSVSMMGLTLFGGKATRLRILSSVLCVLSVGGLVWTGSRGGFLALACGTSILLVLLLLRRSLNNQRRVWPVVATSSGMVLVLLFVAQLILVCRGFSSALGFFMDNGRVNLSIMAVDQITEGGPFGDGAHSTEWMAQRYWLDDLPIWSATPNYAHNEYLQVLADYGLIGFLLLTGCVITCLVGAVKGFLLVRSNSNTTAWIAGAIAAGGAFLVQCLVSFPAHIMANLLTFVAVMAMALKPDSSSEAGVTNKTGRWIIGPLLTSCAAVLGYWGWQGLPILTDRVDAVDYRKASQYDKVSMLDLRIVKMESLVQRYPNHIQLKRLGELYWFKASLENEGKERDKYIELAANAYLTAIELYPREPSLYVNAGRLLDRLMRFEEAENYHLKAFEMGRKREYWIRCRLELARHYYYRGKYVWNKRQPEKALSYFLKARKLVKSYKYDDARKLYKNVNENITFLKKTGIKPLNHDGKTEITP